jgi:hypothetical protein
MMEKDEKGRLIMSQKRRADGVIERLVCDLQDKDWPLIDEWRDVLIAIIESGHQAGYDFCGEQREWHLPRIQKVMVFLMKQFPALTLEAFEVAKDPYGELLMKEDGE